MPDFARRYTSGLGVGQECRDRVHLRADAKGVGAVVGIGRWRPGLEAQRTLAPSPLGRLAESQPDRLRVAVSLVSQHGEVLLRALVQPSLHRPRHAVTVTQVVIQVEPDYIAAVPEGDSLHRAAQRLQVLAGQRVEVETPHPRAAGKRLAERLDGRVLEGVEAVGKNLLLRFEGGLILRSHLRMSGRWRVEQRGTRRTGRPWLVLRGARHEAVLWNGPVLELSSDEFARAGGTSRLGPDILHEPPEIAAMIGRLRALPQQRQVGDALLDQRLVAGIGNVWKAESLWEARVSPWRPLAEVGDGELREVLEAAHRLMRTSVEGTRQTRHVYRRAGRACHRCGTVVRSHGQGEAARIAYWCPGCQKGGVQEPAS